MKVTAILIGLAVCLLGNVLLLVAESSNGTAAGIATNAFRPAKAPGIENFFALGKALYSGSSPEGEAAFEALQKLGIKTIITVDGAKPDVETAKRYGLRYVHLPFGYDGIPLTNALYLVKAAQTLPGPIYVHCHHGKHRGPAAAAIICEGVEGWSPEMAVEWLHIAGTATNYAGLYKSVMEFRSPSKEVLMAVPDDFPWSAKTGDLVEAMVQIDGHFDTLKALQKSGFTPLPGHPDAPPTNESLILFELFREAHREKLGAKRGEAFLTAIAGAEADAGNLHERLQNLSASPSTARLRDEADVAFKAMASRCASCHRRFRD